MFHGVELPWELAFEMQKMKFQATPSDMKSPKHERIETIFALQRFFDNKKKLCSTNIPYDFHDDLKETCCCGDGNGRVMGDLQVPDQIVSQCVFSESQIAFLA